MQHAHSARMTHPGTRAYACSCTAGCKPCTRVRSCPHRYGAVSTSPFLRSTSGVSASSSSGCRLRTWKLATQRSHSSRTTDAKRESPCTKTSASASSSASATCGGARGAAVSAAGGGARPVRARCVHREPCTACVRLWTRHRLEALLLARRAASFISMQSVDEACNQLMDATVSRRCSSLDGPHRVCDGTIRVGPAEAAGHEARASSLTTEESVPSSQQEDMPYT